jgi:Mn-dependent DtxR family transcriptional regulator
MTKGKNTVATTDIPLVLCKERSAAAIRHLYSPGLLHYVRNDGYVRRDDGRNGKYMKKEKKKLRKKNY